jgi:predicted DNA-binding transcriptional regulator AlpA
LGGLFCILCSLGSPALQIGATTVTIRKQLLTNTATAPVVAPAAASKAAAIGHRSNRPPPPKRRTAAPPPLRRRVIKHNGNDGGDVDSESPRPQLPTSLPRLIGKPEVLRLTGVTFPTIWRWMKEDKFPRSRALGDSKTVWLENEIAEWLVNRPVILFKGET